MKKAITKWPLRRQKVRNIRSDFIKIGWSNENWIILNEDTFQRCGLVRGWLSTIRIPVPHTGTSTTDSYWNVLRRDYRTSRMRDFMLPSQPIAKCQHGIDKFFTRLSGMTTTIRLCIASQQMRWRQKITGQVFVPTLWNLRTTGPCRLRELQCTVSEYKLTFSNWHTSSGAES